MIEAAFSIEGAERDSRWLITCDHATNHVPPELMTNLGLPAQDMERHIAYDIGALGTARALGQALGAPVIWSTYSRLVVDPNRGEDDPTLLMKLYDGSVIPGNRRADAQERLRRIKSYHRPYHNALARLAARRDNTVIVALHSFTPQLRGRPPRVWDITVLHGWDARLSDPLLALLSQERDIVCARNEPYPGHLAGDALHRHALLEGRHNTLLEIRQDLITSQQGQQAWGRWLAPRLTQALAAADLKETRHG